MATSSSRQSRVACRHIPATTKHRSWQSITLPFSMRSSFIHRQTGSTNSNNIQCHHTNSCRRACSQNEPARLCLRLMYRYNQLQLTAEHSGATHEPPRSENRALSLLRVCRALLCNVRLEGCHPHRPATVSCINASLLFLQECPHRLGQHDFTCTLQSPARPRGERADTAALDSAKPPQSGLLSFLEQ